eukprot:SM000087S23362  [mRNA]  locus=s87:230638:232448:- [translate_table: standard]
MTDESAAAYRAGKIRRLHQLVQDLRPHVIQALQAPPRNAADVPLELGSESNHASLLSSSLSAGSWQLVSRSPRKLLRIRFLGTSNARRSLPT